MKNFYKNNFKIQFFIKKIHFLLLRSEQYKPYIPNFLDVYNILKIVLVSFLICIIYSFNTTDKASDFYMVFWNNLKNFIPYFIVQLILIVVNGKAIRTLNTFFALLYLIFLNFFGVFLTFMLLNRNFILSINIFDEMIAKFFVSFGILFMFLIYFDWREKNIHPSHIKAKLNFLQSKMKPHFLFNTLNTISFLIKKDPHNAKKMLLNLSDLLRASLKEKENFITNIETEINLSKKYLEIEKIRLDNRLQTIWDVDESLLKIKIPSLLLQPLIENSILHGIQNLEEGGLIEIKIKSIDDNIYIMIKNPLKNQKDKIKSNNISLKNLEERLYLYYNNKFSLHKEQTENYYCIEIKIPFQDISIDNNL